VVILCSVPCIQVRAAVALFDGRVIHGRAIKGLLTHIDIVFDDCTVKNFWQKKTILHDLLCRGFQKLPVSLIVQKQRAKLFFFFGVKNGKTITATRMLIWDHS
jgi:hypothetical protein